MVGAAMIGAPGGSTSGLGRRRRAGLNPKRSSGRHIESRRYECVIRTPVLYPYTSPWMLRFSTNTGPWMADFGLFLHAHRGGRFALSDRLSEGKIIGETVTAEELASLAVRHLPT